MARKLGYVANSAAQMLVTGRSRTVGLVLSRPDLISVDAFVPSMIYGLNETCRLRRYRLLMDSIHDPSAADAYLELAKSKRIDGLIVINPREDDCHASARVRGVWEKLPSTRDQKGTAAAPAEEAV